MESFNDRDKNVVEVGLGRPIEFRASNSEDLYYLVL